MCGGPVVSRLDLCSNPDQMVRPWPGTMCWTLWQDTTSKYFHSASLHAGVEMDTRKLNGGGNPEMD